MSKIDDAIRAFESATVDELEVSICSDPAPSVTLERYGYGVERRVRLNKILRDFMRHDDIDGRDFDWFIRDQLRMAKWFEGAAKKLRRNAKECEGLAEQDRIALNEDVKQARKQLGID
jgi:hypothetical protein